jgi:hypothetical protein
VLASASELRRALDRAGVDAEARRIAAGLVGIIEPGSGA